MMDHSTSPQVATLPDAWAEFEQIWTDHAELQRQGAASLPLQIRARLQAATSTLDTFPEPTLAGIRFRAGWMWEVVHRSLERMPEENLACLTQLMADIEAVQAAAGPAQAPALAERSSPIYTSTADKRAAVVALLGSPEGRDLSNREIARRLKVSPTTVSSLRAQGLETAPQTCIRPAFAGVGD